MQALDAKVDAHTTVTVAVAGLRGFRRFKSCRPDQFLFAPSAIG